MSLYKQVPTQAKLKKPSTGLRMVPVEIIERKIYLIRGQKIMLDSDLAELYQVPTKALNQAVRRNLTRFPDDFMFRLTKQEAKEFNRSQSVTGSQKHRDPRLLPYAFTEQGVAMLSSVLSSGRAVEVNIAIMRTFVHLRQFLATHQDLARKLEDVERTQNEHSEHIQQIYGCLEELQEPPPPPLKRRIGFATPDS